MGYRIKLKPSGREFETGRQETLLEAALRAGLSPPYRCGQGNCGECKARHLSGEIGETRFHDFQLTAAEKTQGVILLCRTVPASDMEIEATLAGGVADIPRQRIKTRVSKLERLDGPLMRLRLRTPRTQRLRFLAGQHVRLEIPGLAPRNKSIASGPCEAPQLEFHVRHVVDDPFAEHVFAKLKPGDPVTVHGPWGNFVFDDKAPRPVLLLAYETGFAPIKSLIEQAMAVEFPQPLHLYWLVREPGGHYLDQYCRSLVDALDGFSYRPLVGAVGQSGDCSVAEDDMRLAAETMLADHPDIARFEVYANGPRSIMTVAKQLLLAHGLPAAQLHIDHLRRF